MNPTHSNSLRIASSLAALAIGLFSPLTHAQTVNQTEPENSGWSLHFDNDLFAGGSRDQDYTGGIAITLSGQRARRGWLSIEPLRARLDKLTGFSSLYANRVSHHLHAWEFGVALFTPSDITETRPNFNDHPYASLFFLANSRQTVLKDVQRTYQSTLTLGVLGLSLGGKLQSAIHSVIGSEKPQGWKNQISAGGEPTLRYSMGMQQTVVNAKLGASTRHEVKLTSEANLGFTTDANVGFSYRFGRISSPWWSFNPHQAEYVNLGSPAAQQTANNGSNEFYVYLGATAKYRLYNAMLQGQFRNSAVTFDGDQLKRSIVEFWLGATYEFKPGWRLTAFARTRTAELNLGAQSRRPVWGGFVISRSF